jgi:hypothetical protein
VKFELRLVQLSGLRCEVDVRPLGLLHVLPTLRLVGVPHIALRYHFTDLRRHKRTLCANALGFIRHRGVRAQGALLRGIRG